MNEIIVVNIKLGQLNSDGYLSMSILVTQMDENGHEQRLLAKDCSPDSILSVLEANDNFHESYQNWGNTCRYGDRKVDVPADQVNNFSQQDEERTRSTCARDLSLVIEKLNQWIDRAIEAKFIDSIIDHLAQTNISLLPIKLVFQTPSEWSDRLHALPWDACSGSIVGRLKANRPVDIVIGAGITPGNQAPQKLVKILIIQGDITNINTEEDIKSIERYLPENFSVTTKSQPTDIELNRLLWRETWHIIFYLGHTNDMEGDGNIHLNEKTISIEYLSTAFIKSIDLGLHLLVFNSCSGMNIAKKLSEILERERKRMPHLVVMRRPIGDSIAHEFIDRFCEHLFQDKYSVEQAITETKKYLKTSASQFPGADSLPVLWCNSNAPQLFIAEPDKEEGEEVDEDKIKTELTNDQTKPGGGVHKPWILTQLVNILWKPRLMKLPPIAYIGIGLATIAVWPHIVPQQNIAFTESMGEVALFKENTSPGNQAFKQKNYPLAIRLLNQKLISNPNDIQTRIYLNNAKVLNRETNPKQLPIIIAIANDDANTMEILAGDSIAQLEMNERGAGKKVLIKIMTDQNKQDESKEDAAKRVARKIVEDHNNGENIQGVVGHTSSLSSIAAGEILNTAGIVMIAPSSSDDKLTQPEWKFIFRTTASSSQLAEKLANHIKTRKERKIGFCAQSIKDSKSFREALIKYMSKFDGEIVKVDCDYNPNQKIDPQLVMQKLKNLGASSVLIYSHVEEKTPEFERELAIAARANGLKLFGSASFQSKKIIDDPSFDGIEIITPRVPPKNLNTATASGFTRNFQKIFGTDDGAKLLTSRTMFSYDAMKSIVIGLEASNGKAKGLQEKLHDKNFFVPDGSSGENIRFNARTGDRYIDPLIAVLNCKQDKECEYEVVTETPKSK